MNLPERRLRIGDLGSKSKKVAVGLCRFTKSYLLIVLLLLTTICSLGQALQFNDLNDFTEWMTNFYKHPEPHYLFDAFRYGTSNQEIAKSGSQANYDAIFDPNKSLRPHFDN